MKQIQSHELVDVYRIQDGLLVEVHKYESLGGYYYTKMKTKRATGCKGGMILTEDFTDEYRNKVIPKGTYLLNTSPVKPVTNINDFRFEIRSSGGVIQGKDYQIDRILLRIDEIIKSYKVVDSK